MSHDDELITLLKEGIEWRDERLDYLNKRVEEVLRLLIARV